MVVPPLTITREEVDEGLADPRRDPRDRRRVRRRSVSDVAELTARLVAIESINPDVVAGGSGEVAVARFVAEWCERAGLETTLSEPAPGRANVVAVARGRVAVAR